MVAALGSALVTLALPCLAAAGPNPNTAIVLHAVPGSFGPCQIEDPCGTAEGPRVTIEPSGPYVVYVMLRNYANVSMAQMAFQWHPSWSFFYGLWDCQPSGGAICEGTPVNPGGPTAGTFSCRFDCITGGSTAVIGRMTFNSPQAGCLEVIESSFPYGTYVYSCDQQIDAVVPSNRGRVCVGAGGYDACESVTPVESQTWGAIKCQYR